MLKISNAGLLLFFFAACFAVTAAELRDGKWSRVRLSEGCPKESISGKCTATSLDKTCCAVYCSTNLTVTGCSDGTMLLSSQVAARLLEDDCNCVAEVYTARITAGGERAIIEQKTDNYMSDLRDVTITSTSSSKPSTGSAELAFTSRCTAIFEFPSDANEIAGANNAGATAPAEETVRLANKVTGGSGTRSISILYTVIFMLAVTLAR